MQPVISEVIVIPSAGELKGSDHLMVCGYKGRPVVFRADEFPPGALVVHVPVDTLVNRAWPDFSWLEDDLVRVRSYFGKPSWGFFVAAPEGSRIGDTCRVGWVAPEPPPHLAVPVGGFFADMINAMWNHFSGR